MSGRKVSALDLARSLLMSANEFSYPLTKPRRISGTDIAWPTRVPNRTCRLSWGISDRVGTSGMSESLLESAVTGGAILLEVRWTADAQFSHAVNQRCPLYSQSLRSAITSAHYPIVRFKRPDYMTSLNFLKTRHGNVGGRACGEGFQLGGGGARNTECGERMTARSMKFCNSGMFPGQRYRTSASIVCEGISLIRLFIRRA
jgi:hypothetical protein